MPPALAARFTQAEMAALRIISDEVRHHGVCALHIDAIAARAGTCRTTVKNALRELAASTWSRSRSAAVAGKRA
jgi:GTP-sensing pleiotropic transcriptional regulator CodY